MLLRMRVLRQVVSISQALFEPEIVRIQTSGLVKLHSFDKMVASFARLGIPKRMFDNESTSLFCRPTCLI